MNASIEEMEETAVLAGASKLYRSGVELLAMADIAVDGKRPWDLQLKEPSALEEALSRGSLAFGDAYVDGHWEVEELDGFFERLLRARLQERMSPLGLALPALKHRLLNRQTRRRAWRVGEEHYDLGNEFYEAMLDPRMAYTCGYWKDASSLEEAQEAKLDLICRKLGLKAGMSLLDVGCGWGSLMGYAAERYGVRCTGVTISREQAEYVKRRYAGLPVTVLLRDYREVVGCYDRVASVGMFEHVGSKNYRTFMEVARRCLDPEDGRFLLHTIGRNDRGVATDPWIEKHIFSNGQLPSLGEIGNALDGLFVTEDLHNFGADYDRTLMAWHERFEVAWPRFAERMGERFRRKWRYYLLSCAGAFRARDLQLWQWTLSPKGIPGGWERVD